MNLVKISFLVNLFLLGISCSASTACDTLFRAKKLRSYSTRSLANLEIDSSYSSEYFHDSVSAIFTSKRKDRNGATIVATSWRKGWKYWKLNADEGMVEFGEVEFSHADITGDGEPELFLWVFDYFSHHSAMESDERKNYSVIVIDVANSLELLDFTFRCYSSDLIMDLGGPTDSLGNPWPPDVDEYFPLYFYKEKLFVFDSSRVHAPVFLDEDAADSASKTRYIGAYSIDRCADHSGIYVLKNNSWIRTSDNTKPAGNPMCPPEYYTWWEIPLWKFLPKDPPEH